MEQTERQTDFRSVRFEREEKRRESRSRKNGVLRENQKSKTHLWLLACVSIDWEPARLTESDMQTEEDFPMSKGGQKKNRENPSGQKLSHLYFVQRSLCRTMPNKEGTTVITLFLPPGFPRESTHKTRQPGLSRFDPRGVRSHLRTLKTWLGAHFSRFREVWSSLTKVNQGWPSLTKVWPRPWPDQKHDLIDHPLTIRKSTSRASIRYFKGKKRTRNEEVMGKTVKIGPTLSKIVLSVIDKTVYLRGDVCT